MLCALLATALMLFIGLTIAWLLLPGGFPLRVSLRISFVLVPILRRLALVLVHLLSPRAAESRHETEMGSDSVFNGAVAPKLTLCP